MKTGIRVTQAIAGIMVWMFALDVCAQVLDDQTPYGQAPYGQGPAEQVAADQTAGQTADPRAAAAQAPAPALSPEQLDQMLAPIALYPDALLAQVLMASTYPLEIVEADRWLQNPGNAALKGAQLDTALQQQEWDPSVKSLVPFPQILRMMDDHLSWTEQVGDAFLADRAAVMDSVQRLRQLAQAAGNLKSTPYQTVSPQASTIIIESPSPDVIYVPVYDPFLVYGAWPYPGFPPYYFAGYFTMTVVSDASFGWFGLGINFPLWGWSRWDWPRHHIFVDRHRFNQINVRHRPVDNDNWRHDPEHRHGVPYRYPQARREFQPGGGMPDERRHFRGYPPREQNIVQPLGQVVPPQGQIVQPLGQVVPPQGQVVRPLPQLVTPPMTTRPRQNDGRRDSDRPNVPHQGRQPQAVQPQPGQPQAGQPQIVQPRAQPRQFSAPQQYRAPAPAPPASESYGRRSEVRTESERGRASRQSQPAPSGQQMRQYAPGQGGKNPYRRDK